MMSCLTSEPAGKQVNNRAWGIVYESLREELPNRSSDSVKVRGVSSHPGTTAERGLAADPVEAWDEPVLPEPLSSPGKQSRHLFHLELM